MIFFFNLRLLGVHVIIILFFIYLFIFMSGGINN